MKNECVMKLGESIKPTVLKLTVSGCDIHHPLCNLTCNLFSSRHIKTLALTWLHLQTWFCVSKWNWRWVACLKWLMGKTISGKRCLIFKFFSLEVILFAVLISGLKFFRLHNKSQFLPILSLWFIFIMIYVNYSWFNLKLFICLRLNLLCHPKWLSKCT